MTATVIEGDCLKVMRVFEDNEFDAIVTDPPYALTTTARWKDDTKFSQNQSDVGKRFSKGFMGKEWDGKLPGIEVWQEALRVSKPGAHMLAFGGTRTHHRLMVAIEDAGWEIRDCLMWVYGSGFPKSLDVSKAIDKAAGVERDIIAPLPYKNQNIKGGNFDRQDGMNDRVQNFVTAPATDAAKQWNGWGTALKPAWEPIILCRKPLDGTVANNVQKWGVGGINIDGCRVEMNGEKPFSYPNGAGGSDPNHMWRGREKGDGDIPQVGNDKGRFPANLIHDGSDEVLELFPDTKSGNSIGIAKEGVTTNGVIPQLTRGHLTPRYDNGSAARFFKCCSDEDRCSLCCLPYAKDNNKELDIDDAWKNLLASIAEKNGWTIQATTQFIAHASVLEQHIKNLARNVKFAGSLCDLCATSIAAALVKIKTSDFNKEELQVILDYTGNSNNYTLIQNLVSFVEIWGNIDIIPTTTSLSLLFGFANPVITNCIHGTKELETKRFVYSPKASRSERGIDNKHPTVKPLALMRYLCKLITPPNGLILDPFAGSGSTGVAASAEGFESILIELESESADTARKRNGGASLS